MNDKHSLTGRNIDLLGASQQEFTILTENVLMREIILKLRDLMNEADGVVIEDNIIPWSYVLPLANSIPSTEGTEAEIKKWMITACELWQQKYNASIQDTLAKRISSDSTIENDNLYLLNINNVNHLIFDSLLPYVDLETMKEADPELAKTVCDMANVMVAISKGAVLTNIVRTDIYCAGVDDALMALQSRYNELKSAGQDTEWLEEAMQIITDSKQQSLDIINQETKRS
ncbi:hypothetical protein [Photorhabdus aegyptia]|uniref:Uncharacterized protein n=1 Tax=Photorhabdus aegyptia TaxID=2805098 RepID=A0A022PDY3_9GAMM|nr:hypothetical protein [Photorhabdus aegyptia]EYU13906.1 hypothetical protein BA1DRAFT_03591 [Photorhabdus aegyptia]